VGEDHVDVARVVQLGAAELAHPDHDEPTAGLGHGQLEEDLRDRRDLGHDVVH
jgi:hypothetical protein